MNKNQAQLMDDFGKNIFEGLLPEEQIIAPEQTVTIVDEPAAITMAEGYSLPNLIPNNWTVIVNGTTIPFDSDEDEYHLLSSGIDTRVYYAYVSEDNFTLTLSVGGRDQVPGDYTVKITEAAQESGGILLVKDNGGGLDKTAAEIWGAMQTGLVLVDFGDGVSNLTFDFICRAHYESGYTFTTTPNDVTYNAASDHDYPRADDNG